MDNEQRPLESQEELNAEKDMVVEVPEDTLREKLAEQLGLDPKEQSAILDNVVKLKQEDNKRLSKAIEQKRKYREQLFTTKKPETKSQTSTKDVPDDDALFEQRFNERMEKIELERLDFPEDLKAEIQKVAKYEGIPIREAAKNPYILHKKQEFEQAERIKNATPTRTSGGKYIVDPSKPLDPSNFDMSTPEGRKAWDEAKAAKKRATN